MRKTRYFLDDNGGVKISSSLSRKQIQIMAEFYQRQGMKEVSKKEWFNAKKKWHPNKSIHATGKGVSRSDTE